MKIKINEHIQLKKQKHKVYFQWPESLSDLPFSQSSLSFPLLQHCALHLLHSGLFALAKVCHKAFALAFPLPGVLFPQIPSLHLFIQSHLLNEVYPILVPVS